MATGRAQAAQRKAEETEAKNAASAAVEAIKPTEIETLQNQQTLGFLKEWTSGKDVKDMQGLSPYFNLYEGAKNQQAGEHIGGGLLGASASNTSGLATALKSQQQARKEQAASGQLYNAANQAYQYASGVLAPNLMQQSDNRQLSKAQIANNRYAAMLQRPPQQHPFLNLLGSALGQAGQLATSFIGGAGGGGFGLTGDNITPPSAYLNGGRGMGGGIS